MRETLETQSRAAANMEVQIDLGAEVGDVPSRKKQHKEELDLKGKEVVAQVLDQA